LVEGEGGAGREEEDQVVEGQGARGVAKGCIGCKIV
jgi:hypothetical protein